MTATNGVLIIGGGIGGLTLALQLERAGIRARVLEAVPDLKPLGVGINILPHASKELWQLGVQNDLTPISVQTSQSVFYNRFGQFIHADPAGNAAGFPWPQYSIHRGELQLTLAKLVRERLGEESLVLDAKATGFVDHGDRVTVRTVDSAGAESTYDGVVAVGCDGVHSTIRRILHPDEGALLYSGYTMWRGTTRMAPYLDGASMVRVGWLETGKLVIYPILNYDDGTQLVNWVAEIAVPQRTNRNWNQVAEDGEFFEPFEGWDFDWLDIPAMLRGAERVYEYPMLDQDSLPFWTKGGVTLLGDAAHPMVPRGSNGAGQAILDTRALTDALVEEANPRAALTRYERERLPRTAEIVQLNRVNPPDALLREVFERTGDLPFEDIANVISPSEVQQLLDNYRAVTGSSLASLTGHESRSGA
ncbi:flavin-dependent oxidoreductase [Dactylosporangium sp. NPDC051484]|uniref:flavin-dependent oxidoreductase n=1 Tax=Dactylosporangium sp. NPDC051484 TaxID=3154942 RepID=UPI00344B2C03